MNSKVLRYGIGNYVQYPVINHNGREYEKECIYTYIYIYIYTYIYIYIYIYIYKTGSFCCIAPISTT